MKKHHFVKWKLLWTQLQLWRPHHLLEDLSQNQLLKKTGKMSMAVEKAWVEWQTAGWVWKWPEKAAG